MLTLADVLRRHGEAYLLRYGDAVLPSHVRAVRDVLGAARVNSVVILPSAPAVGTSTCVITRAEIERARVAGATRPRAGCRSNGSCCCR